MKIILSSLLCTGWKKKMLNFKADYLHEKSNTLFLNEQRVNERTERNLCRECWHFAVHNSLVCLFHLFTFNICDDEYSCMCKYFTSVACALNGLEGNL